MKKNNPLGRVKQVTKEQMENFLKQFPDTPTITYEQIRTFKWGGLRKGKMHELKEKIKGGFTPPKPSFLCKIGFHKWTLCATGYKINGKRDDVFICQRCRRVKGI